MIYLDYNSTAPWSPKVRKYLSGEILDDWANASSPHLLGEIHARKLTKARETISEFLDCSKGSLVFTSGATESINTILNPLNVRALGVEQIVSSKQEHSATLACVARLEQAGFPVVWINAKKDGSLYFHEIEEAVRNKRSLVSLMYVNNETGVINYIPQVSEVVSKHQSLLHVDASQALGKIRFSLSSINADFASFSGHKIGSLKGVGLLYCRDFSRMEPLLVGGGQESGYRPGTTNLPGARSLELAIEDIDLNRIHPMGKIKRFFEEALVDLSPQIVLNSELAPRVFNTSNVFMAGVDAQEFLLFLSSKGICASNGSACTSGSIEPSHVLTALGFDREYAKSCVRFSMGFDTTSEEIQKVISAIEEFLTSKQLLAGHRSAEHESRNL